MNQYDPKKWDKKKLQFKREHQYKILKKNYSVMEKIEKVYGIDNEYVKEQAKKIKEATKKLEALDLQMKELNKKDKYFNFKDKQQQNFVEELIKSQIDEYKIEDDKDDDTEEFIVI